MSILQSEGLYVPPAMRGTRSAPSGPSREDHVHAAPRHDPPRQPPAMHSRPEQRHQGRDYYDVDEPQPPRRTAPPPQPASVRHVEFETPPRGREYGGGDRYRSSRREEEDDDDDYYYYGTSKGKGKGGKGEGKGYRGGSYDPDPEPPARHPPLRRAEYDDDEEWGGGKGTGKGHGKGKGYGDGEGKGHGKGKGYGGGPERHEWEAPSRGYDHRPAVTYRTEDEDRPPPRDPREWRRGADDDARFGKGEGRPRYAEHPPYAERSAPPADRDHGKGKGYAPRRPRVFYPENDAELDWNAERGRYQPESRPRGYDRPNVGHHDTDARTGAPRDWDRSRQQERGASEPERRGDRSDEGAHAAGGGASGGWGQEDAWERRNKGWNHDDRGLPSKFGRPRGNGRQRNRTTPSWDDPYAAEREQNNSRRLAHALKSEWGKASHWKEGRLMAPRDGVREYNLNAARGSQKFTPLTEDPRYEKEEAKEVKTVDLDVAGTASTAATAAGKPGQGRPSDGVPLRSATSEELASQATDAASCLTEVGSCLTDPGSCITEPACPPESPAADPRRVFAGAGELLSSSGREAADPQRAGSVDSKGLEPTEAEDPAVV
eukprot:EG_transcript_6219